MAASLVVPVERPTALALTAFTSLFGATTAAGTFGSIIPYVLRAMKQDPAVATGVFITTTNDVVGVLLFFGVASIVYL